MLCKGIALYHQYPRHNVGKMNYISRENMGYLFKKIGLSPKKVPISHKNVYFLGVTKTNQKSHKNDDLRRFSPHYPHAARRNERQINDVIPITEYPHPIVPVRMIMKITLHLCSCALTSLHVQSW